MERPNIPNIVLDNTLTLERFQNETLRPIIKMKDEILIAFISKSLVKKNKDFQNLNSDKKKHLVQNTITKDIKLNQILKGMIIGQFYLEELNFYESHQKELSKRIIQIIIERYLDRT